MANVDRTLAALADPTRRGVIDLLRKKPRRAGELADALDTTAPAMSRHLRVLRQSGLVEDVGLAEDARVRLFQLRRAPFDDLRGWLERVESFWTSQLDSFADHVERTRGKRP